MKRHGMLRLGRIVDAERRQHASTNPQRAPLPTVSPTVSRLVCMPVRDIVQKRKGGSILRRSFRRFSNLFSKVRPCEHVPVCCDRAQSPNKTTMPQFSGSTNRVSTTSEDFEFNQVVCVWM